MNRVELTGYYGGDLQHALAAWTSTSRELSPDKKARIPALLKMLAEQGHHTPFERSALHFLVDCEVASHIHILKHRIGVSVNGESARYKELLTRTYIPEDWPSHLAERLETHHREGEFLYHDTLKKLTEHHGMDRKRAKESARFFLGYSNVTTVDVMFNFRSFMHFQKLRNDPHAQKEIRDISQAMLDLVRKTDAFTHSLEAYGYKG